MCFPARPRPLRAAQQAQRAAAPGTLCTRDAAAAAAGSGRAPARRLPRAAARRVPRHGRLLHRRHGRAAAAAHAVRSST